MAKKITFFTPTLHRTGSEIVLMRLLPFLKGINPTVVTRFKGSEFDSVNCPRIYLCKNKPGQNIILRAFTKLFVIIKTQLKLSKYKNSVWYINTIAFIEPLEFAKKHNIPVILHVHESEHMYKRLSQKKIKMITNYPALVIANSKVSAEVFREKGRSSELVILNPSIDINMFENDKSNRSETRASLNYHDEDFVWLMSGTVDRNKNLLLLIEIAEILVKKDMNVRFMWIGGVFDNTYYDECLTLIHEKKVEKYFYFSGSLHDNYVKYFKCADGFVLTSTFESFSIVTLEALLLGLPIVAQDCGGVSEVLGDTCGVLVKNKNAQKMAVEMFKYMESSQSFDSLPQKKRALLFDQKIIGDNWFKIVNNFIDRTLS